MYDGSRYLGLFRKAVIRIITKCHRTNLVICSHSRDWETPPYSRIYDITAVTLNIFMMSLVKEHGRQCMPCSTQFSVTLQTENLLTEISDFLKQIIFLRSFNSVLDMYCNN